MMNLWIPFIIQNFFNRWINIHISHLPPNISWDLPLSFLLKNYCKGGLSYNLKWGRCINISKQIQQFLGKEAFDNCGIPWNPCIHRILIYLQCSNHVFIVVTITDALNLSSSILLEPLEKSMDMISKYIL